MKLTLAALATTMMVASPALADLIVPNMSYRTGPYAANGIPYADGFADYFTLLNERDGGIGGQRIAHLRDNRQATRIAFRHRDEGVAEPVA